MNQKDIKLLWGRAANRCSICRTELSQNAQAAAAAFTLGEQAHIVGEREDAARGRSMLTDDERNSYHNIILLCPNHHTEIDKNEADWPVEKLHYVKSAHELWVRETLGEAADRKLAAKQVAVTAIIDTAVTLCNLENWKAWTSHALAPDPVWETSMPGKLYEFRQRVAAAIWTEEFDELKRATVSLAILLHNAASTFTEHAAYDNELLRPHKFYRGNGHNPNYHRDLALYGEWLDECYRLIRRSTCAANWFADVVRRDINPMFFAERGKFVIEEGPFEGLRWRASIPEFSEEEKMGLPDSLLQQNMPAPPPPEAPPQEAA
jgi:hypothetical protein